MKPLRIGRLARLANVNVQTVRFYERQGLLAKPLRRPSGYREYSCEAIGLVRLIKHVQGLGFSLKEIKGLIAMRKLPSTTLGAATVPLENKINELDAKIHELSVLRGTLAEMLDDHRRRQTIPFAQLFDQHIERLASEALECEQPRPRKLGPAGNKRLPKSARDS